MGKPPQRPLPDGGSRSNSYTDDAVSMHTTPEDYTYNDDIPHLPSYSDSEATFSHTQGHPSDPPPTDEYAPIQPPTTAIRHWQSSRHSKPVSMHETSIRMNPQLNDADALYTYITNYLRIVKPNPAVRITGHHSQTTYRNNKKETERVVDFDFSFSFQKYLRPATPGREEDEDGWWRPRVVENGDRALRGGWRKVRAKGCTQDVEITGDPRRELMEWCREFCESGRALKVFRVEREVVGLDSRLLGREIEGIIRGTHYRGHIDVFFPVEDKNVDIYSDHVINRWRITWVRYIFYVTFLWIITWPVLFFMTARWGVYKVTWAFSRQVQQPNGSLRNEWASIDETTWLRKHENLIKSLALEGCQADATEFATDVEPRIRRTASGQIQTGHAGVDGAMNFIQGGVTAWNAIQGRDVSSFGGGWGGDSC